VFSGYRNSWFSREYLDGIEVIRVKTYITANEGLLKRTLDYVSFMATGFLTGCLIRKPDILVATSPQFFAGLAGALLGVVRSIPFVLEVRDLWPASIVAVGAMKRSRLIRGLEVLERWMYRRAAAIVVTSRAIGEEVSQRVRESKVIRVVTNGIDQSFLYPRSKDEGLMSSLGLNDKFVIGYIGTLGLAHGLENVLQAAKMLEQRLPNVRFLLVGSGADQAHLQRKCVELKVANVVMVPQQLRGEVPRYLSLCDVALVHLKDNSVFSTVIPSKIFEAFAMGLPILGVGPIGEASNLVTKHQSGLWVAPADAAALADAVESVYRRPSIRDAFRRAAIVASKQYDRTKLAIDMLNTIKRAHDRGSKAHDTVVEGPDGRDNR
jgi:colanic acid biosynthesis glycosyl transferase WcaI